MSVYTLVEKVIQILFSIRFASKFRLRLHGSDSFESGMFHTLLALRLHEGDHEYGMNSIRI